MQGLADGYFVLPYTIGDYLAAHMGEAPMSSDHAAFNAVESEVEERIGQLLSVDGKRTVDSLHRELGHICWEYCGMSRQATGLSTAIEKIQALGQEFWENVRVPGSGKDLNQSLEKAGRVADYFELAELMCRDALRREESCGTHFREEHQSVEGEAVRKDEDFSHVAAWEFGGAAGAPTMHKEVLHFENVPLSQRSYK
jgi:succinate dehydrogenase / fumarate reductase flavoprotein subunit